ncbi:MmyB family transcriptional regulator [Amaricoccus solimangrovi]|uniref:Helix-turn-helix transcriptional regulator n=1 Tax=Amaricoccus solimangrovi TaxID=2589815 RepID=A0A501WDW6_9RHOB|nr:helix-turn-helix domain-containing protein [Amaricoccus solimangrovi]TPE48083.1 helix-turn-helix transcriptional regulator [Amaricoccus solimangrovi]
MQGEEQRRLLGRFIRSHRERLRPDAPTGRRRTPGLRREELAARAGLSVTWCAWIEQGRDIGASPAALARLAAALALTPAERAYLFELAGRRDPEAPAPGTLPEAPGSVRALVAAVAHPAYGLDRFWTARCWNPAAADLFAGWLGPGRERNLLRYTFTDPSARDLLPDWEDRARRLLAEFRADYGRALHDPDMAPLVDRLRAESDLFARAWDEQGVAAREGGPRGFRHPVRGLLAYEQYTFSPLERPDYKLVTLWPVVAAA